MLVLTRKQQQQISIGDDITVTVLKVKGNSIRLGIEAPKGVRVLRAELTDRAPRSADADEEIEPPARSAVASGRQTVNFDGQGDRGGQADRDGHAGRDGQAERGEQAARREATYGRTAAADSREGGAKRRDEIRGTQQPMPPTDRRTRGLRAALR